MVSIVKLIEPTSDYDKQIQAYRCEFLEIGGMNGAGSLRRFENTLDRLNQIELMKKRDNARKS